MELTELKSFIQTEMDGLKAKAAEEFKNTGTVLTETKTEMQNIQRRMDGIEQQLARPSQSQEQKGILELLKESEDMQRLVRDGRGTAKLSFKSLADLESKTTITSSALGNGTQGVLMPMKVPGIVAAAEQEPRVRSVLSQGTTTNNAVYFLKENAFTNAASPQVEASDKAQSALTFTTDTSPVITLAHWIPVTKQALADFNELASYVNRKLMYGLKYQEDVELLTGSGTGQHLSGLITEATAFNTALMVPASAGWNKADVIRRALEQVEIANEYEPDFIILNPAQWADIELTKATTYEYVAGNAFNPLQKRLWGKTVVTTNAMPSGSFLVGSGLQAQVWDRMGATIDISTEHSDYFIKNMVAIRCEERLALTVYRPAAFIYGTLNTSPA